MSTRILLDVDTGIDDAMAIVFACAREAVTLEAVTCVYGNIDVASATRNTIQVLDAAGRSDVPVAAGAARSLTRAYERGGRHIHGENGLGNVEAAPASREPSPTWGPDLIIERVRAAPGALTLVPVGPMTNVAHALMKAPDIAAKLKRIVLMGGTLWHPGVPGIPSPVADANFFNDPEAARIVLKSGADVVMVGMDVTMRTKLTAATIERIAGTGGPAARLCMEAARFYLAAYQAQYPQIDYCALHDPLAVAVAEDGSVVTLEPMQIDVECVGELTRGQAIPDRRRTGTTVPNAKVAVEVDAPRFEAAFEEAMLSGI